MLFTIFLGLEALAVTIGNSFTIAVFRKHKLALRRTFYLLINLTVADLMIGITATVQLAFNIYNIATSQQMTRLAKFDAVHTFFGTASIVSLLTIALETLYAIAWPFRHRLTSKRTYILWIAVVWCFSAVLFALELSRKFSSTTIDDLFSIWFVTCGIIVILITISCSYLAIWFYSKKEIPGISQNSRLKTKKRAKTLFIVTLLSVITWLPFALTEAHSQLVDHWTFKIGHETNSVLVIGRELQLSNSFLNPIVYSFRMPEFRRSLKHIFSKRKSSKTQSREIRLKKALSTDLPQAALVGFSNLNPNY